MWRRSAVVAVAMICSAGSSGCMARRNLEIHATHVQNANQQGVIMNVFVRVENPNDVGARIRNVRAAITVDQRYPLPAIHYDANHFAPANGSALIVVPAIIPWANVRPLLRETARQSQINYVINGQVDITAFRVTGLQVDNFYISETGSVSRAQLLAVAERTAWQ